MSTSKRKRPGSVAGKRPSITKTNANQAAPKAALRKAEDDYHHGDLRRALLSAGLEMLEADGLEALSLREVARRAGVSHNAPYRHFADREALLAAIAAAGFDALGSEMEKAEGDRLGIGVAYVRFAVARPRLFDLMFGPALAPHTHAELDAAMGRSFAIFAGEFALGSSAKPTGAEATSAGARAHLIAPWALVHGLAHLLLGRRMAKSLTGGLDVETLTRAVLAASTQGSR